MRSHEREDPVDAMILDSTPKEFVDWLVKYKGLREDAAENVEVNLREQFKWHRLQGRLDQAPLASLLAELWMLRQHVNKLKRPIENPKSKIQN